MWVIYSPADGDTQRWEYDPEDVLASKAEMIEKRFGASWEQFGAAIVQGSMKARRVLLWHLQSQDHPTLRFENMPDFRARDLSIEFSAAELVVMRDRLAKANLADDVREQVTTALDIQIADAMAKESLEVEPDDGDSGKALSPDGAESTG